MEFITNIGTVLQEQTATPALLIFLLSAVFLVAGVAVKTWSQAVQLSFLEYKPLNWIEYTHPHMPSMRRIVTIALCSAVLIIMALQIMQGSFLFTDPYQGLNVTSLFILCAAIGILAELKWKGAGEYTSAALAGTALAFLCLLVLFNETNATVMTRTISLVLLLPTIAFSSYVFGGKKQNKLFVVACGAFVFWIFAYLVQQ